VDRIDFEELALKGVDPSFGPRLREHESKSVEKGKDAKTPEIIVSFAV
jgi:hypothetical protein